MLAIFNAVTISLRSLMEALTPSFWIGYAFVTAVFIGQAACAWYAFRDINAKKRFYLLYYNLSLYKTSFIGLFVTFFVAVICMLIPPLPWWVTAILCVAVLAFNFTSVGKAKLVVETVSAIDKKVEQKVSFIYSMRAESEALLARASTDEAKASCKKVRDAFQYSDPMSADALAAVEAEIQIHFEKLNQAIREGNADAAMAEKDTVLALIAERNAKCKMFK